MRFDVITIFPEIFPGPLASGVIGKALDRGLAQVRAHDLRSWATAPHYKVDDEPFGGGAGMVFTPDPLFRAVESVQATAAAEGREAGPVVLLSPQGRRLDQATVNGLLPQSQMTLICGRYEGVDERVREHLVDDEISIGDYVLSGGELAGMVLIETVIRLLPDVLGDPMSARHDSFVEPLLEHPHYTRPAQYRGWKVPEVLRSGDHGRIRQWRRRESLRNTVRKRPDLLAGQDLSAEDQRFVKQLLTEMRTDRTNGSSALE